MSGEEKSSIQDSIRGKWGLFKKNKSPSPEKTSSSESKKKTSSSKVLNLDTPPLTPLELTGYSSSTRNRLLTPELGEEIRNLLPARLQIESKWKLLYSLEQHGASLKTLYNNTKNGSTSSNTGYDKSGYLLVIKDDLHDVFGGYVNEYFHPTDSKRYSGNGECFLWKSRKVKDDEGTHIQFQAFPYTGENDYLIYGTSEFLSIGGGEGRYGLWIDQNLLKGNSHHTKTFGNEQLSRKGEKFEVLGVEVWRV